MVRWPWNPNAMRVSSRILVLVDSTSALGEAGVEGGVDRGAVGDDAALRGATNAGMRERRAQAIHRSSAILPSSPLTANT